MNKTYSSGYGGSGKSRDPHSHAASVTFAICGPYKRKMFIGNFMTLDKKNRQLYLSLICGHTHNAFL